MPLVRQWLDKKFLSDRFQACVPVQDRFDDLGREQGQPQQARDVGRVDPLGRRQIAIEA